MWFGYSSLVFVWNFLYECFPSAQAANFLNRSDFPIVQHVSAMLCDCFSLAVFTIDCRSLVRSLRVTGLKFVDSCFVTFEGHGSVRPDPSPPP